MKKTLHSIIRCSQRGIPESNVELILSFGTSVQKPGGVSEYFVSKKDKQKATEFFKQCIQNLDKLVGKAIIVDERDSIVITAYHKTK